MQISNRPPPIILSYVTFGLALLISSTTVCLAGSHQKRLIYQLLDTNNAIERPVASEADIITVTFGLSLMNILQVDEIKQIFVTNMWVKMKWIDVNLRWNASEFGGLRSIRVPLRRIWEPDIYLYNNADDHFDVTYPTKVVVTENGSCFYVAPLICKSFCKMDLTWFPFDYQRCELKFGSWAYDGLELDIVLQHEEGGDLSSFLSSSEWELLEMPGRRNEIYYSCCREPYVDVTFIVVMRRRPFYYLLSVIVPCILMASMALLGFAMPSDSGEKLTLGVTNFLSITFFLIMMSGTMPTTPDAIPLIDIYLLCIKLMVASSVAQTVLVSNIHHRDADTMMSRWFRVLFLHWLPWVLFMNRPSKVDVVSEETALERLEMKDSDNASPSNTKYTLVEHELSLILAELRQITKQLSKVDAKRDTASDWKFAAKVLDRLCFIVFTLFTVLATIAAVGLVPASLTNK